MKRSLIGYGLKTISALVLVVSASSLGVTSTTYAGVPIPFKIINEHSSKVLSVSGWDPQADGALILQYTNDATDHTQYGLK